MISDNGIGILKDEIDRVFDKGFTGTNGRNDKKAQVSVCIYVKTLFTT